MPQLCSAAGVWQDQPSCQFICTGGGFCSECTPGARRCEPVTGRPQLCSTQGAWQNQTACATGSACSAGVCECTGSFASCGSECVDLTSDADHCGECNRSCFPAQGGTCEASSCTATPIATGETFADAVFLSETHVYWQSGLRLRRVLKTGGGTDTIFTATAGSGALSHSQIANNQLYFVHATSQQGGIAYRVMRANLDGSSVSAFSPAYVSTLDGTIVNLVTSDTFVFHTVASAGSTTIFRAPVLAQGQTSAGLQTNLGTLTGGGGAMAASGNCLYYTPTATPAQILRKCSTAAPTVHHSGTQAIVFLGNGAMDGTNLYFREGNSMARIGLAVGSTDVPLTLVNPGLPTVDPFDGTALYYFLKTGGAGSPACTNFHTLFRAGTDIGAGNPVVILPPPNACPTGVAVDATALYWSNRDDATVMKLGK